MSSLKKSSKKSRAGSGTRTTAKTKSSKRASATEAKRTMAKAASTSSRKSAASRAARARAETSKTKAKPSRKTANKAARVAVRAGSTRTKAAHKNTNERKATPVEMRNKKASAQKAETTRKKAARSAERKTTTTTNSRRAVATPAPVAKVTKATKNAITSKPVKAVEPVVEKAKELAAKTKSRPVAAVSPSAAAKPSSRKLAAKPVASAEAAKPAAAATPAAPKPESSASTILLETIRRVGQAAAGKARTAAPEKPALATVVPGPAPTRPEAPKPASVAPAPVPGPAARGPAQATAPAPAAAAPVAPNLRPGDPRLHHLQPRPVVKTTGPRPSFKLDEFIVYPAHGVGQVVAVEEQEVAGFKLELYVISFAKDKMTLKVPTPKVVSVGMRKLAEPALVQKALDVLTGRARIKRTMWSRRAQEYEAKINSGDLIAIAEVIRDLYRSEAQPEQSYSERQLYEAALDRMAREVGAVQRLTETETLKVIETQLQKGPRRGPKPEGEADNEADGDPEIEDAAA